MTPPLETTSTRPYLLRAIYEWCADNDLTPYIAAMVDESVQVPMEFVKDGEIVLNISMNATSSLQIDNEFVHFKARFGGVAREIFVPIDHVIAIYARENGQGMAFPATYAPAVASDGQTRETTALTPTGLRSAEKNPLPRKSSGSNKIVSLKSVAPIPSIDDSSEPPPTNPSKSRPSLTRIK